MDITRRFSVVALLLFLLAFTGYGQNQRVSTLQATVGITTAQLTNNGLTASRVLVSDPNKGIVSSATTATEVGHVSGVTSALQTQLNNKQALDADLTRIAVDGAISISTNDIPIAGITNLSIVYGTNMNVRGTNVSGTFKLYISSVPDGNGGAGSQTPLAQDVNATLFALTNLGQIHLNGEISATPTNLTGTVPLLLMSGHSTITFTPTGPSMVGVVTPGGADWIWPPKILSLVVTGETVALVHPFSFSNAVAINTLAMAPGTNYFGLFYDGITNRVFGWLDLTNGHGPYVLATNATITTPTLVDAVASTSFRLPNGAAVTTDAFGEIGGDNNIWAAGRGALQVFDGTANTLLVGVLASDTATDLQVPKFNVATGTITWENDNNSGAATAINDIADATGNGTVNLGTTIHQWISTLDSGDVIRIDNTDTEAASTTTHLALTHADQNDAQVVYIFMNSDSLGANKIDYEFSQTRFFSRINQTNEGAFLNLGPAGFGNTLSVAGLTTLPGGLNLSGGTFTYRNGNADVALGNAGETSLNTTDEQLSFHSAADGEISGEASISLIQTKSWTFDPKAVCDGTVDRLFLMWLRDEAPEGIIIDEWQVSFEADPTTELDVDLKYADAMIGVANPVTIDALDTTAGTATEDTDANINGGAVIPNGKVLYLEFATAYTEANHQCMLQIWYHHEED